LQQGVIFTLPLTVASETNRARIDAKFIRVCIYIDEHSQEREERIPIVSLVGLIRGLAIFDPGRPTNR